MPSVFSKLTLHTDIFPVHGMEIKSPLSGLVSLPDAQAPAPYQAGLLPDSVQIQLQDNQVLAPFQGKLHRADAGGSQILLLHPQGLRLEIRFPPQCQQLTQGFRWLVADGATVRAGQPLLQLDIALLQQWFSPLCCWLTLLDHPKIARLHSRAGYVAAERDTLFWLELHTAVSH